MSIDDLSVILKKSKRSIFNKASREGIERLTVIRKKRGVTPRKLIDAQYYKKNKDRIMLQRRERAKAVKLELIQSLGGKCRKCGYNKCPGALDFHHLRDKKELVSVLLSDEKYDLARDETLKCELLCANCHREFHYKGN
jgi:hypothetical protein